MADMDQGIKRLLQMRPGDIITYILPGARFIRPLPTDIATEPQLLLDTLYEIELDGARCLVNIEAQTAADPDMPRRLFKYAARADALYDLPVIPVVLWLTKKGVIPTPPYRRTAGEFLVGTWNFINVEIYALPAHDMITTDTLALLPLVPLMQGADADLDAAAMRRVKDQIPGDQGKSMAALLAVFIARQFGKAIAERIVQEVFMSTELLDESPLYREWIERATREGLQKGKLDGMRATLQTILTARLGPLTQDITIALAQADEALLTEIVAHAASDSLEQVRARLHLA